MSHRTGVKMPVLEEYTKALTQIIKDINIDSGLNRNERAQAIKVLEGLKLRKMSQIVKENFSRPVDTDDTHTKDEAVPLAESIANTISKHRPKDFKSDVTPKR
ncbi:hypothetical protein [Nitrososphaeria virus YSH_1032793]|uniref:Uncharacterized protein n=1 Tax=Nitrososphaeria virus YSH_1032793 TaxID=3071320 RepID=A0A976UAD5_9CAUD|nr:hypothetical protein QKV91_gp47 [Yangshan Harbor Nitrososphaeria virus]UVF62251.1 hypothetical protein [Nitrososphaeria virus YSH_1032793]